jgi:PPOX class probable F420-dependent enzyme
MSCWSATPAQWVGEARNGKTVPLNLAYGGSMALADEKYVRLTTFRRSGEAVPTPVWFVALDDGRFGFYTSSTSGKVKRLNHTPTVTVQASDSRGNPKAGAPEHAGSAEVVSGGPLFDEVKRKIQAKHPVMRHITKVLAKIGGIIKRKSQPYADRAVVVRLDTAD